jgi:hypothetical protein
VAGELLDHLFGGDFPRGAHRFVCADTSRFALWRGLVLRGEGAAALEPLRRSPALLRWLATESSGGWTLRSAFVTQPCEELVAVLAAGGFPGLTDVKAQFRPAFRECPRPSVAALAASARHRAGAGPATASRMLGDLRFLLEMRDAGALSAAEVDARFDEVLAEAATVCPVAEHVRMRTGPYVDERRTRLVLHLARGGAAMGAGTKVEGGQASGLFQTPPAPLPP